MKKWWTLALGTSVATAVGSYAFASNLPDPMPIHWGADGLPDGFAPKAIGLLMLPVIGALVTGIMAFVSGKTDKPTAKVALGLSALLTVLFLGGVQVLMLAAATGPEMSLNTGSLMALMGLFFAGLGLVLKDVEPNKWAGFRSKWTFSDETIWKLTHEFGAKTMVIGGAVCATAALLLPGVVGFWIAFAALILGATLPMPYSWMLYRARKT